MDKLTTVREELSSIIAPTAIVQKDNALLISPTSSETVAAVLKAATKNNIAVRAKGGGRGWWASTAPPEGGILLKMTAMNTVIDIDQDLMTVTVESGITFKKLEEALDPLGYRIKIFPESGLTATVGGHVTTWGTSPFTSSLYEDQATQIVGLKVVVPTGEIIPTGSDALLNSAGHFSRRFFPADLSGIFIGSDGAFGVVTEVSLKIYPHPECSLTRLVSFTQAEQALALMTQLQKRQRSGGLLTLVEQRWVSAKVIAEAVPRLQDQLTAKDSICLVLRTEGPAAEAEAQMEETLKLAEEGGARLFAGHLPEWWAGRFSKASSALVGKGPRVMIVAIAPFKVIPAAIAITEKYGDLYNLDLTIFGYPFGGPNLLLHTIFPWEAKNPRTRKMAEEQAQRVMEELIAIGCVPHRVGSDFLPVITKHLDPAYLGLIRKLKECLDPAGIMNPGVVSVVVKENLK